MGDESHNRPAAGTLLFASILVPYLIDVVDKQELLAVTKYLAENEIFFLCMSMEHVKQL